MSVAHFLDHLQEPDARFMCRTVDSRSGEQLEVPTRHSLGAPADHASLAKLRDLLGAHSAPVEELYSQHDGCELYVQSPEHVGLVLFPIREWEPATERFRAELEEWGRDPDGLFDFERDGLVFGEPPGSGNYFLFYEGAVYYFDHDGGDDTPLADSFHEFLDRIVSDPPQFLEEIGCFARYSDGKTKKQWIPERYVSRDRAE